MITENQVKKAMESYLIELGFERVVARFGTAPGIDVEGIHPISGRRTSIECKGETAADGQWDRAWRNTSAAMFNAIKITEHADNTDQIALAFPDNKNYLDRMAGLQQFCRKQEIEVYWVSDIDGVRQW